jgi:hypothetical protein
MTGTTAASRLTAGVLGRTLDSIPPAAGAEVMGTRIVSTRNMDEGGGVARPRRRWR